MREGGGCVWCLHERHRRGEFVQHFLLVFGQKLIQQGLL